MGDDGRDSWTGRSVETQTELRLGSAGLSLLEERALRWMPRLCSVSAKPVWRRKLVRRSCSVICCLCRGIDDKLEISKYYCEKYPFDINKIETQALIASSGNKLISNIKYTMYKVNLYKAIQL